VDGGVRINRNTVWTKSGRDEGAMKHGAHERDYAEPHFSLKVERRGDE
jgi:hypothetical protein